MSNKDLLDMNTTVLAYMGDAVYEVRIRKMLIERAGAGSCDTEAQAPGRAGVDKLHHKAISYVSAAAQARIMRTMIKNYEADDRRDAHGFVLNEQEYSLVKRARNHRSMSRPRNADPMDYKYATAFEALLGYLFFDNQLDRMITAVDEAVAIIDERFNE